MAVIKFVSNLNNLSQSSIEWTQMTWNPTTGCIDKYDFRIEYLEDKDWIILKIFKLIMFEYIREHSKLIIGLTNGTNLIITIKGENEKYWVSLQG